MTRVCSGIDAQPPELQHIRKIADQGLTDYKNNLNQFARYGVFMDGTNRGT